MKAEIDTQSLPMKDYLKLFPENRDSCIDWMENEIEALRAENAELVRERDTSINREGQMRITRNQLLEQLAATEAHNLMLREALDLLLNDVGRASSLPGAVLARAALSATPSDALEITHWLHPDRIDPITAAEKEMLNVTFADYTIPLYRLKEEQ